MKQISRILKAKIVDYTWFTHTPLYGTRKDFRNQRFNPFEMRAGKARSKIRRYENRRYRRSKMSVDNHKKFGVNYQRSIF